MFLLVCVCHVGAHLGGHQHGVSIQISINLGKTFLQISQIRNVPLTWILTRVFGYLPPFISQILDFIYWTVLSFILIYFEWRATENQQYPAVSFILCLNVYWTLCTPLATLKVDRILSRGLTWLVWISSVCFESFSPLPAASESTRRWCRPVTSLLPENWVVILIGWFSKHLHNYV